MATKSTSEEPLIAVEQIDSLSSLTAQFMSARSHERSYLPRVGARWWRAKFDSMLQLNQFVSRLYKTGFSGDIETRGTQVEIHATAENCIKSVMSLIDIRSLVILSNAVELVEVSCDAHAILNNQAFNGALVSAGNQLCWIQVKTEQSAWSVLELLSSKVAIEQVAHFDPSGEIVVVGDEIMRGNLLNWLSPFCK